MHIWGPPRRVIIIITFIMIVRSSSRRRSSSSSRRRRSSSSTPHAMVQRRLLFCESLELPNADTSLYVRPISQWTDALLVSVYCVLSAVLCCVQGSCY